MSTASVELLYPEEYYEELIPVRGFGTNAGSRAVLAKQLDKARHAVARQVRAEAKDIASATDLKRKTDLAWKIYRPMWTRHMVPQVMASYGRGFIQAKTGRVPENILAPIAQDYAEKMGDYFNESSSEALMEGYQALVNRRVPSQMAANTVLDAYGLTGRQMRAYVASEAVPKQKITSLSPMDLKRKAKAFIGRALRDRFKVFADEEIFKTEQQAHQLVWMFENRAGRIPPGAKRLWITADDEKVCPRCGPLHMKKVGIEEPFETDGGPIWMPGMHVNCRCKVRLWVPTTETIRKDDDDWDEDEVVRDKLGRFAPEGGRGVATAERDPFLGERQEVKKPERTTMTSRTTMRTTMPSRTTMTERTTLGAPKTEERTTLSAREALSTRATLGQIVEQIAAQNQKINVTFAQDLAELQDAKLAMAREMSTTDPTEQRHPNIVPVHTHGGNAMTLQEIVDPADPMISPHSLYYRTREKGNEYFYFEHDVEFEPENDAWEKALGRRNDALEAQEDTGYLDNFDRDDPVYFKDSWIGPDKHGELQPIVFQVDTEDTSTPGDIHEMVKDIRQMVQERLDANAENKNKFPLTKQLSVPGVLKGPDGVKNTTRKYTYEELINLFELRPRNKVPVETHSRIIRVRTVIPENTDTGMRQGKETLYLRGKFRAEIAHKGDGIEIIDLYAVPWDE